MALSNTYPSLEGKAVFMTGGGSGIGAHIVEGFLRQKAKVWFIDIDEAASRKSITDWQEKGLSVAGFTRIDVRDILALQGAIRNAAQEMGGKLDVLVNNAARDDRHDFSEVTEEYWDNAMNINLRPHFFGMQAAAPFMAESGGSMINMGSVSWMRRRKGFVGYSTSKGAISAMTRTMAQELGPKNIRVNSVVPGAILTERQQKLWVDPALEQSFIDDQALKFRILPDDVVAMVLFLASADARACTGQNFLVDAGIV